MMIWEMDPNYNSGLHVNPQDAYPWNQENMTVICGRTNTIIGDVYFDYTKFATKKYKVQDDLLLTGKLTEKGEIFYKFAAESKNKVEERITAL